jgi:hypothetical protein
MRALVSRRRKKRRGEREKREKERKGEEKNNAVRYQELCRVLNPVVMRLLLVSLTSDGALE